MIKVHVINFSHGRKMVCSSNKSGAGVKPHFLGLVFKNCPSVVLSFGSPYLPHIIVCSQTDLLFYRVRHPQVFSGRSSLVLYALDAFSPLPIPQFLP